MISGDKEPSRGEGEGSENMMTLKYETIRQVRILCRSLGGSLTLHSLSRRGMPENKTLATDTIEVLKPIPKPRLE